MPYYNTYGSGYPSYAPMTTPAYPNNLQNSYMTAGPAYEQDTMVSWVQGKSGAEAYPLAPGKRAMLMDSNEPILYVKATDVSGRYLPLQSYRLVPIEDVSNTPAIPQETIDYDRIREIIADEVNKKIGNKKENR